MNDNHRQREPIEALLVFKIAIDRDHEIERGCSQPQFAVFDAQPASATVLTSWPGISLRSARGTHSSSSTRIGNQAGFCLLKRGNDNLARNGRKVVKEFVQRVAALDLVDQCLYGNARADEHGRAAQDIGVGVNDGNALSSALP